MKTNVRYSGGGGLSFSMVLFLIFLVLKLTGNITWSWWWVTSPLWISAGLFLMILPFILIFAYWKYKDF